MLTTMDEIGGTTAENSYGLTSAIQLGRQDMIKLAASAAKPVLKNKKMQTPIEFLLNGQSHQSGDKKEMQDHDCQTSIDQKAVT